MFWGEELQKEFYRTYGNMDKKGTKAFIDVIDFEDNSIKQNLLSSIDGDIELIWYPGCGGDVSPCSILERKHFEKDYSITTSNKRIYIFTDPDQYRMCESAFGKTHNIYDCSVSDYADKYDIEKSCNINVLGKSGDCIINGYFNILSLGDKVCNIIYLKMTMQDYLSLFVKLFELDIKWLFYLKMESKGGPLFNLYKELDIPFPNWICANRVDKFGINELAELKPMVMKNGDSYYIDEDRKHGCANVMFGKMKKNHTLMDNMTTKMSLISLLKEINVLCRDNGREFDKNNSQRIRAIEDNMEDTDYKLTKGELYLLYHKKDLTEYKDDVLLISSHIDCKQPDDDEEGITKCFSSQVQDNLLKGTYDNSITNTAILYLMMKDMLPENVIVAFTGDEEENSEGAIKVTKLLKKNGIKFKCIVLDVTDAGWDEQVDFTIENNFWGKKMGEKAIDIVERYSSNWLFVPEELDNVPSYVKGKYVYSTKSEADESWDYDEENIKCFSLCIPVQGNMHSDEGVFARVDSFEKYTEILQILCSNII